MLHPNSSIYDFPNIWEGDGCEDLAKVIRLSLTHFASDLLTSRERDVVSLIIQGSGNKEIADSLDISVCTVKVHRKSAYGKLGISSVGELFQAFLHHLVRFSSQVAPFAESAA
ncbi:helix-turn-helix transcriptional regulator [Vibrio sp. JC009]|uniref:response regulator transcription factor n=1 Tax=Vibrio sp. JC009 TaxID=2912314 RepID=UPI0023B1415D|nr:helix-turn-helix transcriptional regulator [Vibrio sp. JC009]WED23447.1 helix-turn-helix transcriptional regulator [Vibrio sp. JC009]